MEEDLTQKSFLGKGWAFPPSFSKPAAGVQMAADCEDIEQSLRILLSTRPGERIMQPSYGCNLDRLLFEPLDASLKTYMEDIVKTSILYFEPRIQADKISINRNSDSEGTVLISIDYIIRTTNSRYNLVVPFYTDNGTSGN